jgi:hypothetical protein
MRRTTRHREARRWLVFDGIATIVVLVPMFAWSSASLGKTVLYAVASFLALAAAAAVRVGVRPALEHRWRHIGYCVLVVVPWLAFELAAPRWPTRRSGWFVPDTELRVVSGIAMVVGVVVWAAYMTSSWARGTWHQQRVARRPGHRLCPDCRRATDEASCFYCGSPTLGIIIARSTLRRWRPRGTSAG